MRPPRLHERPRAAILAVLLAGAACWSGCSGGKKGEETDAGSESSQPSAEARPGPPETAGELPSVRRLDAAREALESFLAMSTAAERLPLVYEAERTRPQVEAWHASRPDGAFPNALLRFMDMDEAPADGGDPFYAFHVFPGGGGEFPMVVRQTLAGYKVDWELFAECVDRRFERFRLSDSDGPEAFRLLLQRHSYWGPDSEEIAALDAYLCFKIEPPYRGNAAFVFVPKGTPLAAEFEELAAWGMPPVDVVLALERKAFPHGTRHLVASAVLKASWVAP